MQTCLQSIYSRHSAPVMRDEPVPGELIEHVLRAGMCGNDHGRLMPWHFRVYQRDGRARLADAFCMHERRKDASASISKARALPYRAPVIICVLACLEESRIPIRDQLFAAASACQLITLSAHALGLSAIWRTGEYAESPVVAQELRLRNNEQIVGFIYVGYSDRRGTERTYTPGKVTFYE